MHILEDLCYIPSIIKLLTGHHLCSSAFTIESFGYSQKYESKHNNYRWRKRLGGGGCTVVKEAQHTLYEMCQTDGVSWLRDP